MPRDFTLKKYSRLIDAAIQSGYELQSYERFVKEGQSGKAYILRHDVDDLPEQSLATAKIEAAAGVKGTYYFRVVKQSYHPAIVDAIAAMGHEIGYHYEDMALCGGNYEKAYEHFLHYLEMFRQHYPVKTICMHGSPMSKWDNRLLWERYDYKKSGIIAEPYFDTNFNKVFYITDTSRSWKGSAYSVRDKVNSSFDIQIQSTDDLIRRLYEKSLPDQIMQNIHPQRWQDNIYRWAKELVLQNLKNIVKAGLAKRSASGTKEN